MGKRPHYGMNYFSCMHLCFTHTFDIFIYDNNPHFYSIPWMELKIPLLFIVPVVITCLLFVNISRCYMCEGEFCEECHSDHSTHAVDLAVGVPVTLSGNCFINKECQIVTKGNKCTHY